MVNYWPGQSILSWKLSDKMLSEITLILEAIFIANNSHGSFLFAEF